MLPNKPYLIRACYDWIIDSECTPYVVVDTTVPFVDVPKEFIQNNQIVLNVSPMAVRDLHLENKLIRFNARFSGEVKHIYIPIKAVMAVYAKENGRGMIFDANESEADHPAMKPMPEKPVSVAPPVPNTGDMAATAPKKPKKGGKPSHLKLVD